MKLLAFTLTHGCYGVPVASVHAVLKPVPVTRVPAVGSAVLGVFNLRSMVLPLIDLESVLTDEPRTGRFSGKKARFVVCEFEERLRAFQVQEVKGIFDIAEEGMDRQALRGSDRRAYFDGVCRLEDGDCVALLIDHLLNEALQPAGILER